MVGVICFVITFFKPFIIILKASTNLIEKVLKIKPQQEEVEEELKNEQNGLDK